MIPFTRYTTAEPVQTASPYDPAVSPDAARQLLAGVSNVVVGDDATVFEVRALGPLEVRTLSRILPTPSAALTSRQVARLEAKRHSQPEPEFTADELAEDAWHAGMVLTTYLRAGLVRIVKNAPDGWPEHERDVLGTLRLWPEHVIAGLPEATTLWLGSLVAKLTHPVDAEKKRGSGS